MTRNPNESNKQFQSSFRTKRSKKIKKTRKSSASSDKYLIAVRSRESYAPLKPTAYSILNARKEFLRSSHTKSDQNEMELCFPNTGICRLRKFQPKTLTFSSQLSMQRPQEPSFEQERNVKSEQKKGRNPQTLHEETRISNGGDRCQQQLKTTPFRWIRTATAQVVAIPSTNQQRFLQSKKGIKKRHRNISKFSETSAGGLAFIKM